ncbi:hypothetical protein RFM26_29025 [Mesorhizobium sp. VK23B]|uniref:Transposase n=1 Tax=Mesorhizobium dulcispinae TaxID=3072316 RepID=A0ABU4XR98_9HYPH|nr:MULTISPECIES: hypothetical protein [unclassified Mesorhizobium]MDX8469740.1 hypothetical protein [Mesorhizobium sp. VK23B]MDX8476079.1 hypothetical protein [Mesorhizobium sp. VK23A]
MLHIEPYHSSSAAQHKNILTDEFADKRRILWPRRAAATLARMNSAIDVRDTNCDAEAWLAPLIGEVGKAGPKRTTTLDAITVPKKAEIALLPLGNTPMRRSSRRKDPHCTADDAEKFRSGPEKIEQPELAGANGRPDTSRQSKDSES